MMDKLYKIRTLFM